MLKTDGEPGVDPSRDVRLFTPHVDIDFVKYKVADTLLYSSRVDCDGKQLKERSKDKLSG